MNLTPMKNGSNSSSNKIFSPPKGSGSALANAERKNSILNDVKKRLVENLGNIIVWCYYTTVLFSSTKVP